MKYPKIISLLSLTLCSLIHAQKLPNIVFILADDMSFDSVSANNDKIGDLKTPHIDKLISDGMNFTDAHSGSAVCTPTRYGILTGRYCWRTKLKNSVLWTYAAPLIEKERLTVAEMLREKGYRAAMVGKWHLGLDWRDKNGQILNDKLKLSDSTFRSEEGKQRIRDVEKNIDFSQPITGGPIDHGFDYYWGVDVPNFPPTSGSKMTAFREIQPSQSQMKCSVLQASCYLAGNLKTSSPRLEIKPPSGSLSKATTQRVKSAHSSSTCPSPHPTHPSHRARSSKAKAVLATTQTS